MTGTHHPEMKHSQTGGSCYNNTSDWNYAVYGGENQHALSAQNNTIAMNSVGGSRRRKLSRRSRRRSQCGGYRLRHIDEKKYKDDFFIDIHVARFRKT